MLIVSVAVEWTGPLAAVAMPVGQVVTAMLLVSVARPGPAAARTRRGRAVAAWTTAGMLTLLVLLFVFYAHYDIAVPVPQAIVRPLAALVMGFAALRASMTGALVPARVGRSAAIPALLLLAVPGIQLATLNEIEPAAGTGFPVRVMTYNIHQGFDAHGRHGMEALAQIIEAQDPDIVALQEVSRGWLINGSVDTLVWLSQRLGMAYVFGPAADQVWGNAVLSRLPIRRAGNHRMPNNDDIVMDRGFLMLEVDVGGGETLEVLATHFHNGEEEEDAAARLPQSLAVLEAADSDRTMVLLGDLNASPHHPEMLLIADAGFVDAFVLAGPPGDGYTWLSDELEQRIDYVWTSPDLRVTDFAMPMSIASDHLGDRRDGRPVMPDNPAGDAMDRRLHEQIEFLCAIDELKRVERQTTLLDGSRRENSAEHSWHLALYAMVLAEYGGDLDVGRVLRMVLVHDIVGDRRRRHLHLRRAGAGDQGRARAAGGRPVVRPAAGRSGGRAARRLGRVRGARDPGSALRVRDRSPAAVAAQPPHRRGPPGGRTASPPIRCTTRTTPSATAHRGCGNSRAGSSRRRCSAAI